MRTQNIWLPPFLVVVFLLERSSHEVSVEGGVTGLAVAGGLPSISALYDQLNGVAIVGKEALCFLLRWLLQTWVKSARHLDKNTMGSVLTDGSQTAQYEGMSR